MYFTKYRLWKHALRRQCNAMNAIRGRWCGVAKSTLIAETSPAESHGCVQHTRRNRSDFRRKWSLMPLSLRCVGILQPQHRFGGKQSARTI